MKTLDNLKLKAFKAPKRGKTGRFLPRCTTKTTPQTLLERLFIQSLDGVMRSSFPLVPSGFLAGAVGAQGTVCRPVLRKVGRDGVALFSWIDADGSPGWLGRGGYLLAPGWKAGRWASSKR
jgi:hypothetical protein